MTSLFLKILNMSISASWLVLAVLILSFVLKRAPKWVNVLLWGIVAVRLICPFSIESALSLIPSAETITPTIMMDQTPSIQTGIPAINSVINPVISNSHAPAAGNSVNPLQIWIPILTYVWVTGMTALLVYTAVSCLRLRRGVSEAVILRENIYQCENIGSPFVLGIVRPKIYLPYHIDNQDLNHVVAHEQAHIRRKDHWWKPLGFLLLTIHWFNPLMWLAYVLLCRDIELACDEKVIKKLDSGQRADYTQALVACSVNRRMIAACPLAFGEVGVKERVRSVMNYREPAFLVIVLAVAACVAVSVCFLTDPVTSVKNPMSNTKFATFESVLGTTYVSWQCLYMNPLSSYGHTGDSGYRYEIGKDFFAITDLLGENNDSTDIGADYAGRRLAGRIPVSKWEWQEFPYTTEEWEALFWREISDAILDIRGLYGEILYQPLDDQNFLLLADGDLLLVTMKNITYVGRHIWSIYSLIDETNMGVAQWEYAPMLSSRLPAFRFEFDMDYSNISALCTNGKLVDVSLNVPKENALYWSPMDETGSIAGDSAIQFICTGEDGSQYTGTLYISAGGRSNGRTVYTATLVGSGLHLSPNTKTEGGVVSLLIADTEDYSLATEYDLRNGNLELSSEQLPQYVFFTNSTKIAVTVNGDADFEGTVILQDISQNNAEIASKEVNRKDKRVVFTGLTSSRLYRVICKGAENCTLTVGQK